MRATKQQREEILGCHNGVGFLIYKVNDNTTCEVEFFLKDNIPHYITTGKPIEYDFEKGGDT